MKPIRVERVFVKEIENVRQGENMMSGLASVDGEGRLGALTGIPGTGKTWWSQIHAANNDGVYFRVASIWKKSELDFIQALCRELGMANPPGRKGRCYMEVVNRLIGTNRPVFVDEVQRLPKDFLLIVLDLSDATGCPIILVGEPELRTMMQDHQRVWSRTFYALEFGPITELDLGFFSVKTSGMHLPPGVISILHRASGGDLRIVRRDVIALANLVNAKGPGPDGGPQITEELARIAVKRGLSAGQNGNGKGKA